MKKYIFSLIVAAAAFAFAACTPDENDLETTDLTSADLVEGIAYSITHDSSNPNIVYLKNLLGSQYTALWIHPQGVSQEQEVTLKMPFSGTYEVTFGIETRAGIIYGETTTFTVDDFCADFVDNDLWTYISGGVGESKRWIIDLDANGESKYWSGPLFFYGTDDSWETITNGVTIDGDSWSWEADYSSISGWQWTSTPVDFGYMEFDLIGSSNVTVEMYDAGKSFTGVYMLDTDNHTITFTNAELLHDSYNDELVESWTGKLKLLSLTEDAMQIGVTRISDPCMLSINFISQDYYDNWTDDSTEEMVYPELADDWRDYVEPKTSLVNTYIFAVDDTPFDWCDLDGTQKGVTAYTASDDISDISLELNSGTGEYTLTDAEGDTYSGTYTLSDDGVYTFSDALPELTLSTDGSVTFHTNADNTLRIMSYETSDYTGGLTDLWIGSQETDDQGNLFQYLGYHFQPQTSGSSTTKYSTTLNFFDTNWNFITSDVLYIEGSGTYTISVEADGVADGTSPYGVYLDILKILKTYPNLDIVIDDIKVDGSSIEFDDTLIDRGVGDAETTARRYVLNPWSGSITDLDAYTAEFKFTSSIVVTFTLTTDTGTPFISED